jgi:hypothetical protein
MKKNQNVNGLSNVFKALENEEFSADQLDMELGKIGISSEQLQQALKARLEKIKGAGTSPNEEFNPFMIAAKKASKGEKVDKKMKKRP